MFIIKQRKTVYFFMIVFFKNHNGTWKTKDEELMQGAAHLEDN